MYAALFEMNSMFGNEQYIIKGKTPSEILSKFEDVQSLECLVRMGRREENATGQAALDIIEEVIDMHHAGLLTFDELLKLNARLSIGSICCKCVVEGESAITDLTEKYPMTKQ